LCSDKPSFLADLFPKWLSQVAFSSNGLIMKHALDVAVMLHTIAHDEHLGMKELILASDQFFRLKELFMTFIPILIDILT
jgi:hypothetical protein